MTRMTLAAAVACLALAGSAQAQWGSPPAPMPGYGGPPPDAAGSQDRYGAHPLFKKMLWWKKDGCSSGSCKNCGPTPSPYPGGMPGTLVFPNHQYNRSPRDYFMWEK